jgi:hypothetical protein
MAWNNTVFQLSFWIFSQESPRNKESLKLNGTHQILVYAYDHLFSEDISIINENTELYQLLVKKLVKM